MSNPQQGFPQVGGPFVNEKGLIQQAWYQLLLTLWKRTGSGAGVDITVILAELTTLAEELDEIALRTLARGPSAGEANLADAIQALAIQGLVRPAIPACCDEPAILGLARNLFAAALMNSVTIAMTGDGTWSVSFDGSTDVSSALTLATVNADVGTFGDSTHVAQVTVNAKGLVTAISNVAISGGGGGGAYRPLTTGAEPMVFVSDGAGVPVMVAFTP